MADPLEQICDELGVCEEEALFYLEGFRWDLYAAMDACRSKTLPPSSENERAAAEESSRNDKITKFVEATQGTVEDAKYHLSRQNWNVQKACNSFLGDPDDHTERESNPPPVSHDGTTETPWYMDGFSGNEGPDVMHDVLSKVPQFPNTSSTSLRIGSPPSASTPPFEVKEESIKEFNEFAPDAPRTAVIDCLNHCNGIVAKAVDYFYDVYSQAHPSEALKEELIASFSSTTGETRRVANVYLDKYKWDLVLATNSFFDHRDSEVQTSTGLVENRDPPLPSMGLLPSQSQFESSDVSSGSMETQRSPEEAIPPGMASSQVDSEALEEGSTAETVPDPLANRDRTTVEETQTAPSTIMITISLGDKCGTVLELPFRPNQTIRDIRNAIDQLYPDNDRGYYLQSMNGVDYMDWNTTVYRVFTGGCTRLLQTYP